MRWAVRGSRSGREPGVTRSAACAVALGALALGACPPMDAQAPVTQRPAEHPEVVITGTRQNDANLVVKVEQALESDRYLYTAHVTVTADNGVVTLEGFTGDPSEIHQMMRLARRIAGARRVINRIELVTFGEDLGD
jgi:osmotically-inducible protein OsmY